MVEQRFYYDHSYFAGNKQKSMIKSVQCNLHKHKYIQLATFTKFDEISFERKVLGRRFEKCISIMWS